jgi:DNA recombination protein RmuC
LSRDADNLAAALKGDRKLQGNWGEMVLEKLLEDSGLRVGHEFSRQPGLSSDGSSRKYPDVVVHLPRKRNVIIDAKVSLTAFERALRATDQAERSGHLKQHLISLEKHVKSLSSKRYHELAGVQTVDFVLLFVPIEGAFQAAVEQDSEVLTRAIRQRVIINGPATLLATLRTINYLWRVDEQNRNALAIAKQAGSLYDKLVGFVDAFEEVGGRLDQSREAWETARKRLAEGQGNVLRRAERLRELGVSPTKTMPGSLLTVVGPVEKKSEPAVSEQLGQA